MLYFKGCTARERLTNISDATENLLKIFNIDYRVLDNEKCCGSVLLRTGFRDEAKNQAIENFNNNFKDEKILVSCAGCYKTLKFDYKELLGIELDVIHTSQLFKDLIDKKKVVFEKSNISATYHDPCHLGRHCEEYDAPRDVIKSIANLVEMENIRENSLCCGSGGGVKSAFPEIANSIAKNRIEEAEATGCEKLITTCPFCKLNLGDNNSLFEILDLSEFLLSNLK